MMSHVKVSQPNFHCWTAHSSQLFWDLNNSRKVWIRPSVAQCHLRQRIGAATATASRSRLEEGLPHAQGSSPKRTLPHSRSKVSFDWIWFARRHWDHLITMFNYPEDTRRVIYITNAIESVNSVIRKATTRHKMFPNDEAALKVVYLAIDAASKKWTMPIRNWRLALNRFSIEFGDRITKCL